MATDGTVVRTRGSTDYNTSLELTLVEEAALLFPFESSELRVRVIRARTLPMHRPSPPFSCVAGAPPPPTAAPRPRRGSLSATARISRRPLLTCLRERARAGTREHPRSLHRPRRAPALCTPPFGAVSARPYISSENVHPPTIPRQFLLLAHCGPGILPRPPCGCLSPPNRWNQR